MTVSSLVSVIIPCYKQARYLHDALNSVLAQTYQNWECIIVNDGSPDNTEEVALDWCNKDKRFKYLKKENGGLSSARNFGILNSSGEFILPLDADDKIGAKYLEEALRIFQSDPLLKLVYCEAEFFGDESGKWQLKEYNFRTLLAFNNIFCSALFKRADFEKAGGYNSNLIYGWEDWDFWISLLDENDKVCRIPQTLFYYRRKENSMIHMMDITKQQYSYREIFFHHYEKYSKYYGSPQQMVFQIQNQFSQNSHLENENHLLKQANLSLIKSKSYRLGKFILKPFSFLKSMKNA